MTGRDDRSLPLVPPPETTSRATTKRVAGVLLAAGSSRRFGRRNKLLETHDGEPLVRSAAQSLLESKIGPVVVVLGHESTRVRDAIGDLAVELVMNDEYERGQSSSLQAGLEAIRTDHGDVDAALIALGDMPFVSPETVNALVRSYEAGVGAALAPAFDGKRGNPVLFDARFFESLVAVEGDVGGRDVLLESADSALIAVDDPGVRRDVDVASDLRPETDPFPESDLRPSDTGADREQ